MNRTSKKTKLHIINKTDKLKSKNPTIFSYLLVILFLVFVAFLTLINNSQIRNINPKAASRIQAKIISPIDESVIKFPQSFKWSMPSLGAHHYNIVLYSVNRGIIYNANGLIPLGNNSWTVNKLDKGFSIIENELISVSLLTYFDANDQNPLADTKTFRVASTKTTEAILNPNKGIITFPQPFIWTDSSDINATYEIQIFNTNKEALTDVFRINKHVNQLVIYPDNFTKSILKDRSLVVRFKTKSSTSDKYWATDYSFISGGNYLSKTDKAWCAADSVPVNNPDGKVDLFDAQYMSQRMHKSVGIYGKGDPSGDGIINVLDLTWIALKEHYNKPVPLKCPSQ